MVYRFTVISNEVDDFIREIKIEADATFFDFQNIILSSCGYDHQQITSFYICNNHWEQEQEVLLEDMGLNRSDEDIYLMKETHLNAFSGIPYILAQLPGLLACGFEFAMAIPGQSLVQAVAA